MHDLLESCTAQALLEPRTAQFPLSWRLCMQDPVWQKQNTARTARLAVRRMLRSHQARTSERKASALAASNAVMVQVRRCPRLCYTWGTAACAATARAAGAAGAHRSRLLCWRHPCVCWPGTSLAEAVCWAASTCLLQQLCSSTNTGSCVRDPSSHQAAASTGGCRLQALMCCPSVAARLFGGLLLRTGTRPAAHPTDIERAQQSAADTCCAQAAALGLIRDQDAASAAQELWQPGVCAEGSPAGLLCFDEVQITDPFTALVLKGAPQCRAAGAGPGCSLPTPRREPCRTDPRIPPLPPGKLQRLLCSSPAAAQHPGDKPLPQSGITMIRPSPAPWG